MPANSSTLSHRTGQPGRSAGLSVVTVGRLTTAVHVGLVVALGLLVALRRVGLTGVATFGVVAVMVLTAVLLTAWRGRVDRA